MAALTRHGFRVDYLRLNSDILAKRTVTAHWDFVRGKKTRIPPKTINSFKATEESLRSRGFLRSRKEYRPTNNVDERLGKICEEQGIRLTDSFALNDPLSRFNLFSACSKEFHHSLPNSLMHNIETLGDLREFYSTPVNTSTPLDKMRNSVDLPRNLHILYDYHRFHPDTDTMFGGKTAFPKSSTIVSSLRHKKKYRNYVVKPVWDNKY